MTQRLATVQNFEVVKDFVGGRRAVVGLKVRTDFATTVLMLTSSGDKTVHSISNIRGITAIVLAIELV